jgi:glycosyltransferase involved in cell wall biosynthesis
MRIVFLDFIDWDYNVATPYERPLGGTQSIACYLAEALARAGEEMIYLTYTRSPGMIRGVNCISLHQFNPANLASLNADAIVTIMSPANATRIRAVVAPQTKIILWTGHVPEQQDAQFLKDPAARDAHDGFAFGNQWHRDGYVKAFGVDPGKSAILPNAMAPGFENLFAPGESIVAAKQRPWVLAHTSTPNRGLHVLIPLFPRIRQRLPGVRLEVYSSFSVYQWAPEDEKARYGALYEACRNTEGVTYVGSVPQPELAKRLRYAAVLAYPAVFFETAPISVTEALSAGCRVVTSDLGGTSQTAEGFAELLPIIGAEETYADRFVDAVVECLRTMDEPATEKRLRQQVDFMMEKYRWDVRAKDWQRWLGSLM